jgi:signal transduction histidine kinase/CheY-like chemotaxis protein
LNYLRRLLDTNLLAPHGFCFFWRPELVWTHVIADALIGLSYMTIPIALMVIILRRRDIPFSWVVWCFAVFILACGMTHFMMIWTLWRPYYGVEALVKVVTAVASVVTAVLLWRLIPLAISLPSPAHLREVNERLALGIVERDSAIADLERERVERQKAEAALVQAQKMEALGQLTGGLAHDFNNLLQAVQGSLELIGRRAADPVTVKRLVEGGLGATQRGAELTSKLLAFARKKQMQTDTFAVGAMIADMREILVRSSGAALDLRFDLQDNLVVVSDRTQAEVGLLNLVNNARQATPPGGRIVIGARRYEATAGEAGLAPGAYARITVADTGSGMDPEVAGKAFDPFFTTKPVGEGTGLGLSQVYGFATQSGGTARIESAPGLGTTVSLFLPLGAADESRGEGDDALGMSGRLPSSTILLVDDDDHVRGAASEMLADLGLSVVEASSGPEALDLRLTGPVSVAVLDYAMPDMTGAELAVHLRARWPGLPVIFVTGYSDIGELIDASGARETVLRKPYREAELRKAIGVALGVAGAGKAIGG